MIINKQFVLYIKKILNFKQINNSLFKKTNFIIIFIFYTKYSFSNYLHFFYIYKYLKIIKNV